MSEEQIYKRAEKKVDGKFVAVEFEDLCEGDHFRIYERNGELHAEGIVGENPKPCDPPGNWIFVCKEIYK